jgi:hypothetical protein
MSKVVCGGAPSTAVPVIIKCECASRERGYRVDIYCLSLVQLFRLFLLRAGCLVRTYTVEVVMCVLPDPCLCAPGTRYTSHVASMRMKRESERECSVPLKGRCLAHRPAGCGAYQNHIADTFERLMISFREVGLTPNRDLLPINSQFPQLHSRLDDGRLSPASVPLGAAAIRDLDDSFDSPSIGGVSTKG